MKHRGKVYYRNQPTDELKRLLVVYDGMLAEERNKRFWNERQIKIYLSRQECIQYVLHEREQNAREQSRNSR